MWPLLLDMTKDESIQNLRNLELEAYSQLVSALRAQGSLSSDKRKLLKDTGCILNITQERHKAEVRRAISDEKLNTIAYHITGQSESVDEWAQEGRRLVPLLPRTVPETLYSSLADDIAESASQTNRQLPLPSNTERHKPSIIQMPVITAAANETTSKTVPFRIPEQPKVEEVGKKRKLSGNCENSTFTTQLLTPKLCRIQQLYRQKTKQKQQKDVHKKTEQSDNIELIQQHKPVQHIPQHSLVNSNSQHQFMNQKLTFSQNVCGQPIDKESVHHVEIDHSVQKISEANSGPEICNENLAPSHRPKMITNIKPNAVTNPMIIQNPPQSAGPSNEKSIRVCPGKKMITKTVNSQKLIVVSNAQTISTNSILQRTLQIPFVKNVSIKNLEKFKIVASNSSSTPMQLTNVNSSFNSVKNKMVTVKTNSAPKKIIPLSQLQVLNSKGGIKVLPLGGKIVGKSVTGSASPLIVMNTTPQQSKGSFSSLAVNSERAIKMQDHRENGKSNIPGDASNTTCVSRDSAVEDDFDSKIEEFHIPQKMNTGVKHGEVCEINKAEEQNGHYTTPSIDMDEDGNVSQNEMNLIVSEIIGSDNQSIDVEEVYATINDKSTSEVDIDLETTDCITSGDNSELD